MDLEGAGDGSSDDDDDSEEDDSDASDLPEVRFFLPSCPRTVAYDTSKYPHMVNAAVAWLALACFVYFAVLHVSSSSNSATCSFILGLCRGLENVTGKVSGWRLFIVEVGQDSS